MTQQPKSSTTYSMALEEAQMMTILMCKLRRLWLVDVKHCDLLYVLTSVWIWICGCKCCVWINYVDVDVNVVYG
jgi:hypothetical protein